MGVNLLLAINYHKKDTSDRKIVKLVLKYADVIKGVLRRIDLIKK